MSYTQGEWLVNNDRDEELLVYDSLGSSQPAVAVMYDEDDTFEWVDDEEERIANARLIAAAPDLLEACKSLLEFLVDDNPGGFAADSTMAGLADKAQAAIAKAKGDGR